MGNFNKFGGNNRSGGRDSNRRSTFGPRDNSTRLMMYPAVCDDCGKNCEVPFKPTGNREIFCSDCFEKRGGKDSLPPRGDDRSYNRFDRNERPNSSYDRNERPADREMFSAICDDCGAECQLPFKPSSSKPVYCSRCFETRGEKSGITRNDRGDSRSDGGKSKEIGELKAQIISMNAKLEKIMKALKIETEKIEKPIVIEPEQTVESGQPVESEAVVEPIVADTAEVLTVKVSGPKSKVTKKAKKVAAKKVAKKVSAKKTE